MVVSYELLSSCEKKNYHWCVSPLTLKKKLTETHYPCKEMKASFNPAFISWPVSMDGANTRSTWRMSWSQWRPPLRCVSTSPAVAQQTESGDSVTHACSETWRREKSPEWLMKLAYTQTYSSARNKWKLQVTSSLWISPAYGYLNP